MPQDFASPVRRAGLALIAALALVPAAPAQAKIVELGQTAQKATPTCPTKPCLAVSRTTGYQVKVGSQRDLFKVPRAGKIVAWTIDLGAPSKSQTAFFDKNLGGPASAGITVVRPGRRLYAKVLASSPIERLQPYFGGSVQFPLDRSLTVRRGDVITLSVPTWAPALAVGFGNDTSWRATRPEGKCDDTDRQTVQTRPGVTTRFRCLYRTARLTYTATLITSPKPRRRS